MTTQIIDINAPQNTYTEHDESQFSADVISYTAASVFVSEKGSLTPQTVSSQTWLRQQYGKVNDTFGYGKITVDATVLSIPVICLRVAAADARHGVITVANLSDDPATSGTIVASNPYGAKNGYDNNDIEAYGVYCSGPIGTVTDNITFSEQPTFEVAGQSTDVDTFNYTNSYVVSELSSAASAPITKPYAVPVSSTLAGGTAFGTLAWLAEGVSSSEVGQAIWSPNESKSSWKYSDSWLFHIYSTNPGSWCNDVGVQIQSVNIGTYDLGRISFSSQIVAGSTISGVITISGTNYKISVPYDESNDQTIADLCTEIKTVISGANAVPAIVNGQTSGYLNINVSSNVAGANTMTFSDWSVSVPSTATAVSTTTSILTAGTDGDGTFVLAVYTRSNLTTPVETYTCSLRKQLDGYGYQQFIENKVNDGSNSVASNYIRVVVNPAMPSDAVIYNSAVGTTYWFTGGQDGSLVEDSDLAAGWATLGDRDQYDFWFALNGGYTSNTVQTAIANLCSTRTDCFGIIDVPTTAQSEDGSLEAAWRLTAGVTTNYVGIFTPDVKTAIADENTTAYVPPSGQVGRVFGDCAKNYSVFNAAAGVKRGVLSAAAGLRVNYKSDARKVLAQNTINPIVKARTGGYVIKDVLTAQDTTSMLSFIPVRLGFIYIHRLVDQTIEQFEFDNITATEMYYITQQLKAGLKPLVDGGLLKNAGVQCNADNNPVSTAISGKLKIRIWGTGYAPIREIGTDAYITSTDTSYSDYAV